jgi:hypothetical protein
MVVVLNLYERDGAHAYDCSPVIDADGRLLGRTRMIHITEYACFHEQGYYTPGDTGAPVYRHEGGPDRRGDLLRPPLSGIHARARASRRAILSSCRRRARWASGRRALRGGDARGGVPERLLTSRSATASARKSA